MLEAMGCGVPVITTHACNLPEVAAHECGIIIDPDERALGGALTDLLRAPSGALQGMGRNGERLVRDRFSWNVVGAQLVALYGWVLGGGAPPSEFCLELR